MSIWIWIAFIYVVLGCAFSLWVYPIPHSNILKVGLSLIFWIFRLLEIVLMVFALYIGDTYLSHLMEDKDIPRTTVIINLLAKYSKIMLSINEDRKEK